jgi:hypothetical protein
MARTEAPRSARRSLVFGGVALLLALGSYGGVYPWLARVPGLASFRAPARYVVLVHLALAGIGALVFEDLADITRRRERIDVGRYWPLAVPLVLSMATGLVVATRRAGVGSALDRGGLLFGGRVAGVTVPALALLVAPRSGLGVAGVANHAASIHRRDRPMAALPARPGSEVRRRSPVRR